VADTLVVIDRQAPPSEYLIRECLDWVCRDQAANNLPVTLLDRALHKPEFRESLYLVASRQQDEISALAFRSDFPKMGLSTAVQIDAFDEIAARVREDMPNLPCVIGPEQEARRFVRAWLRPGDPEPTLGVGQRIYQLHQVVPHGPVRGTLRPADESELLLLVTWTSHFNEELHMPAQQTGQQLQVAVLRQLRQGSLFIWQDQEPVCLVGAGGPTRLVARIGPVYTPPERRRQGYAGAAVAAASQLMLDRGHPVCCLYTDTSNPTSNHIYQEVGYRSVRDVEEYWFQPQP
jgi:GNAT superfamily N-acetyltransferase